MTDPVNHYLRAKAFVLDAGYAGEYLWQVRQKGRAVTETEFLREYSWVVLGCGFRETVVRRVFPFVSMAYFDFVSASVIVDHAAECIRLASACFGNRKKLQAIVHGASLVASVGIAELWEQLTKDRRALLNLPFIGGVTAAHLLKNLGADVAKNDRHLAKLSVELGFSDASTLCAFISTRTGEPVSAVDIVLWRHCTLTAYV